MKTLSEFWYYINTTGYQVNMVMTSFSDMNHQPYGGGSATEIIPDGKELLYTFIKSFGYKEVGENNKLSIVVTGNNISYYYIDLLNWQQKLRDQKLNNLLND